jgi:hypothetical protein
MAPIDPRDFGKFIAQVVLVDLLILMERKKQ